MKTLRSISPVIAVAAASLAAASSHAATQPCPSSIDPSQFVSRIDNPYFPLVPGTTFFYEGQKDGIPARDEFFVTKDVKKILGVTTSVLVVLNDRLISTRPNESATRTRSGPMVNLPRLSERIW